MDRLQFIKKVASVTAVGAAAPLLAKFDHGDAVLNHITVDKKALICTRSQDGREGHCAYMMRSESWTSSENHERKLFVPMYSKNLDNVTSVEECIEAYRKDYDKRPFCTVIDVRDGDLTGIAVTDSPLSLINPAVFWESYSSNKEHEVSFAKDGYATISKRTKGA